MAPKPPKNQLYELIACVSEFICILNNIWSRRKYFNKWFSYILLTILITTKIMIGTYRFERAVWYQNLVRSYGYQYLHIFTYLPIRIFIKSKQRCRWSTSANAINAAKQTTPRSIRRHHYINNNPPPPLESDYPPPLLHWEVSAAIIMKEEECIRRHYKEERVYPLPL